MIMVNTVEQPSSITVSELTEQMQLSWDNYVNNSLGGLPLHLSGWQHVLKKTYGYQTHYLYASSGDKVAGVLPLFSLPSIISGRRAMTMPGALLADNEEIAAALIEHGLAAAAAEEIDQLVLQDARQVWSASMNSISHHVYWLLSLAPTEEEHWKQLDGNIRRQVRKAKRNGLQVQIDRQGILLDPFYDVFSRFTHQSGTPVFGRNFLENIIEVFPQGFNIAVVWHENQPIAGYFQLQLGHTVYGMWGAALMDSLQLRPAYLALWEIMRDAINNGFDYLDMGRSPLDSNASKFKGQWGGIAYPVYQTTVNINGATSNSVTDRVKSDDKYQLFMRLWPKLPLSLTRKLGPRLRWHIPFA